MIKKIILSTIVVLSLTWGLETSVTSRLKDISRLETVRDNQLIGYGLVVGLAGTGDGSANQATIQGITNMLSNFGVQLNSDRLDAKNVAAVMVTAKLKPFNMPGDQIDVMVSSIGRAKSLRGGVLLLTPLKAANGDVYAVAQGAVSIAGYSISNKGSQRIKNHATVGRIPNGAIVEKTAGTQVADGDELVWVLDYEDFTTIDNVRRAIAQQYPELELNVLNASQISVKIPEQYRDYVIQLIAQINNVAVETDSVARIIINEKTGSLVMGGPIKIAPVVVAHDSLSISVQNTDRVSQPNPLAGGETTLVEGSIVTVESNSSPVPLKTVQSQDNTIEEVVRIFNQIGMTPQDIIAVLQLMKEAGAIKAKIEII